MIYLTKLTIPMQMNSKTFLVSLLAVATILLASISMISAAEIADGGVITTTFNDVELTSSNTIAGMVGDVIPVRVTYTAFDNYSDVKVKVSIEGFRDDISASTDKMSNE